MTTYLIRRLIQGVIVLVLASFVIYTLLMLTPGGPQTLINEIRNNPTTNISQSYIDALIDAYDLDKPWPLNYVNWLFDPSDTTQLNDQNDVIPRGIDVTIAGLHIQGSGVLTGDFGESVNIAKGVPVAQMLGERLGNTLSLTISAQIISILIAFPIGIISAVRQYSKLDYTVTGFSFLGLSMPTFWSGLMLIIFLAVVPKQLNDQGWTWLPYLPPGNAYDSDMDGNIFNRIYHLILPVTVLSFISIAGLSRFVRASMLEVLRQDYVRTAWAKGLAQRVVILKHALRNALIPVITLIMLGVPGLFSGAIITETVFAYAGMGKLYFDAVSQLDIPLVMAFLLITTALIIVCNMLADVLYAVADPRIRFS